MYYLLENGKIINSRISYTANFPYWEIKDNCLFAKSKNDKLVRPCNKNKIKNQSENVYDLIEKEDLIKIKMCDTFSILEVRSINGGASGMKHISAIYKPDANGNYIKVWEVKEDES